MEWTEEMIGRLRALWQEAHSTAEIGRRMGITKNAVVGKAHRLVLAPRPSPIRRDMPEGHVARRSVPRRATGPTLPAPKLPSLAPPPAAAAVSLPAAPRPATAAPALPAAAVLPPRPATPFRSVPMPRARTQTVTCCWPIGDPGTPSFRFCDNGAIANKPYCAEHAAIAYVKVRDRRDDAA